MSTQDGLEIGNLFVSVGLDTKELELGLGSVEERISDVGRKLIKLGSTPLLFTGLRRAADQFNTLNGLTSSDLGQDSPESARKTRRSLSPDAVYVDRGGADDGGSIQGDADLPSGFGLDGLNDAVSNCCRMLDTCNSRMLEGSSRGTPENFDQKQLDKLVEIERGIAGLMEQVSAIARNSHPISNPF